MNSDRQISYNIADMWSLKENDTNELIYKIEMNLQTWKINLQLPEGGGVERDMSGVWDLNIRTTIYKIDKQQETTV